MPWRVTFAPLCSSGGSGHPRPSVDHPCPPPGCWPHRVLRGERPEEPWRADPGGRPVDRRAFTIGLAIAAVAWTSGAARGIMAATFYPLMFFAGLYYPVQLLPGMLQYISHYTPLGVAVQAMQDSMNVGFPRRRCCWC